MKKPLANDLGAWRKVLYPEFQKGQTQLSSFGLKGLICVGRDQFEYPGPTSTETPRVTNIKLHVNSTISTLGAQF